MVYQRSVIQWKEGDPLHFRPVLELLEARDISYSIGGSLLLYLKELPVVPNDVDIVVERELFAEAKAAF